jgi:predicted Zn-dependent protease
VSRAFNLLNAVTDNTAVPGQNSFFVFAPEASAFILREFSRYLRIDGEKKKVDFSFPTILNVVDDPLLDRQVDSVPFDDEGVQGGERFLIRKGKMIDTISNIRTAFENKSESSGNGFRNERSIFPGVRFSNLYIKPTILPLNNLMQDAHRGILVALLKLKRIEKEQYLFSAYGYRFENNELCEPVHFYFKTSFLSYFLNILKVSKELRFFHTAYNIGSPYLLAEASYKSDNIFEI